MDKKNRILDFGGGLGNGFLDCMNCVASILKNCEYHIVEIPELVSRGKTLFKDYPMLSFYDAIPDAVNYDIIHIGSCLQYIDDYKVLLGKLCAIKANYILLTDHYIGKCRSYYTVQSNFKHLRIPYHILNYDEIISTMAEHSYELVFKSANSQEHTYKNVPKDFIVLNSLNLLFRNNHNQHISTGE